MIKKSHVKNESCRQCFKEQSSWYSILKEESLFTVSSRYKKETAAPSER
jgi:hypothetical protein